MQEDKQSGGLDSWLKNTLGLGGKQKSAQEEIFKDNQAIQDSKKVSHQSGNPAVNAKALHQNQSGGQGGGKKPFFKNRRRDNFRRGGSQGGQQQGAYQQRGPTQGPKPQHATASHGGQKAANTARRRNPTDTGLAQFQKKFNKRPANKQQPQQQQLPPLHHSTTGKLRIIPVGGLDEVGKNAMIFEYEDSIFLVDLGFEFPQEELLGIDYVIPDMDYLKDKIHKVKGIVVTHGHLDHIGGIAYLLPKLNFPPIYACKLTLGFVQKQLEEFGLMPYATLKTITPNDVVMFGKMRVSFFSVTHSIPDSIGVFIESPAGNVVHTGDFKIDLSPAGGQEPPDFLKIAGYSQKNVVALFSDSTNAIKPGYTISERKIGETLDNIIKTTPGRLIIASFASQIGRIQQIIDACVKYNRKIFFSGRSLIDNIMMATKLGYLKFPEGLIQDVKKSKKTPANQTVILTTGSQGEPVAALSRMSLGEHAFVKIGEGDTVVLSSSPIPGNEMAVYSVINNLSKLGARIINNSLMDVHASGHAQQEDLKLMFNMVKPKYLVPIHGEYFMRKAHIETIVGQLGMPKERGIMIENGDILEVVNNEMKILAEKARTNYILVDGLGMGDIGSQVMTDRQILAENGIMMILMKVRGGRKFLVGEPSVESRGFIYMAETEEILNGVKKVVTTAFENFVKGPDEVPLEELKLHLRDALQKYVLDKIDRQPLIVPVIVEV